MIERIAIEEMGRDLVALFGHSPKQSLSLTDAGWIAQSGYKGVADLNMAGVYPGAGPSAALSLVRQVRDSGVETILVLPSDNPDLRGAIEAEGNAMVGQLPCMERKAAPVDGESLRCAARRGGEDEMEAAMELAAHAFSLPAEVTRQAVPPAFLDDGQREVWIAEADGAMLGVGLFIRDGERVGVYTMATSPEHQKRGAGKAVLVAAMKSFQARGVERFTLGATAAGHHLYEQVGFRDVAQPYLTVIGSSTQFPG